MKETIRYSQWTAADVDKSESKIVAIPLESVETQNGVIGKSMWVATGIRSHDKARYLYVNVGGCQIEEVRSYLVALSKGKVKRKTLDRLIPKESYIMDIMPSAAQPRLVLS